MKYYPTNIIEWLMNIVAHTNLGTRTFMTKIIGERVDTASEI